MSTRALLTKVIDSCAHDFREATAGAHVEDHERPSAAMAMLREIDGVIELTTLGDCQIVHCEAAGGIGLFGTTALAGIEARTIAGVADIRRRRPLATADEVRAELTPLLIANRRLMNRVDGYWVLGLDRAAADHIDTTSIEAAESARFALASDGLLRLVDVFGAVAPAALLDVDDDIGFDALMSRLRGLEDAATSLIDYPRVKRRDDASFVLCDVVGIDR